MGRIPLTQSWWMILLMYSWFDLIIFYWSLHLCSSEIKPYSFPFLLCLCLPYLLLLLFLGAHPAVLRTDSWLQEPYWCWGPNPGWPRAKQVSSPLYYHFSPLYLLLVSNVCIIETRRIPVFSNFLKSLERIGSRTPLNFQKNTFGLFFLGSLLRTLLIYWIVIYLSVLFPFDSTLEDYRNPEIYPFF